MSKLKQQLKWIENYEYDSMEELKDIIELLEQATPPTAEEVCKALGEYYGENVIFERDIFYKSAGGDTYDYIVLNELFNAPHLITMIGRFYEGVDADE